MKKTHLISPANNHEHNSTLTLNSLAATESTVLGSGKYLELLSKNGWEFIKRKKVKGVVVLIALAPPEKLPAKPTQTRPHAKADHLLLVEQYRTPIGRPVIELPAGLVGDEPKYANENLISAAHRELLEETGYDAAKITPIFSGPGAVGFSDEMLNFFLAEDLTKKHAGGGVDDEQITVHSVPLNQVDSWLQQKVAANNLIDPKIFIGLYLLEKRLRLGQIDR